MITFFLTILDSVRFKSIEISELIDRLRSQIFHFDSFRNRNPPDDRQL